MNTISYALIEEFKSYRLTVDGVAHSTVNSNLHCLGACLTEALKLGFITKKPRIELYRLDERLPKFLSQEEQAELLSRCAPLSSMDRFIRIALLSGLRPREILKLVWAAVDFAAGLIFVRATKSRRDRTVPLHPQLREYLAGLPRNGDRLLTIGYAGVQKFFERYGRGATAHTLRHSFASWFLMSGGQLTALKEILGHKHIQTTMVYAHLVPEHTAREIAKLPGLPLAEASSAVSLAEARRKKVAGDT